MPVLLATSTKQVQQQEKVDSGKTAGEKEEEERLTFTGKAHFSLTNPIIVSLNGNELCRDAGSSVHRRHHRPVRQGVAQHGAGAATGESGQRQDSG